MRSNSEVLYGEWKIGNGVNVYKAANKRTKNEMRVISMDEYLREQRSGNGKRGIELDMPGGTWTGDEQRFINALQLTAQLIAFGVIGGKLSNVRLRQREAEHGAAEFYLDFSRDDMFRGLDKHPSVVMRDDVRNIRRIVGRAVMKVAAHSALTLGKAHWPSIRTDMYDVAVLDSVHDADGPDLFNAVGIAGEQRWWLRELVASNAGEMLKRQWGHVVLNLRAMLGLLENPEKADFSSWKSLVMAMSDEEILKLWWPLVREADRYSGAFGCN